MFLQRGIENNSDFGPASPAECVNLHFNGWWRLRTKRGKDRIQKNKRIRFPMKPVILQRVKTKRPHNSIQKKYYKHFIEKKIINYELHP